MRANWAQEFVLVFQLLPGTPPSHFAVLYGLNYGTFVYREPLSRVITGMPEFHSHS